MNDIKKTINPISIPTKKLYTGSQIPCIGYGTFGSDYIPAETVSETVKKAIYSGYRQIDCASVYGNEKNIGEVLDEIFKSGFLEREDLWITSKVWNDMHDNVVESCKQSLKDLKIDYLDLYLVHWPFPNYHPPHCDVTSRSPNAKPYIHENYMKTWRQMEQLVEDGLVKNIGTSNMTIPKLKLLLRDAKIKPACNEMELHPHFQQPELFDFCLKNDIQPIGYCPLGSPGRPELTPAQIAIKWAIQRGQIPIPFSVNHFIENLEAVINVQLTENDMKEISNIDKNCRLIKGQVFLWKENQGWEDLWDLNGEITPA
ncbi:MAG: aldo/keto reductase [Ignavibacteriaceae bacterium]